MIDLEQFIKQHGGKLVPFISCCVLYFAMVKDSVGDTSSTIFKCAPIISLMVFIVLKGIALTPEHKYSQRILLGLVFSCIGDALLNIDLFPQGMASFGLAHICYIAAFGWTPLLLIFVGPLLIAGFSMIAVILHKLDEILIVGLPIYVILLLIMCWRALARGAHKKDFYSVFCAVGCVLFVLSDGLIAINMFLLQIPLARLWIMSTYYLAQFSIALSTTNECRAVKKSPKRSKPSVQSRINGGETARRRIKSTD